MQSNLWQRTDRQLSRANLWKPIQSWFHVFSLTLFFCFALVMVPDTSKSLNFFVDTTADTTDANANDCICSDSNGECSLRAAVMEANSCLGGDTISIPGGTYILTIPWG